MVIGLAVGVVRGSTVVGKPGGGSDVRVQLGRWVELDPAAKFCAGKMVALVGCEVELQPTSAMVTRMIVIKIRVRLWFIVR